MDQRGFISLVRLERTTYVGDFGSRLMIASVFSFPSRHALQLLVFCFFLLFTLHHLFVVFYPCLIDIPLVTFDPPPPVLSSFSPYLHLSSPGLSIYVFFSRHSILVVGGGEVYLSSFFLSSY